MCKERGFPNWEELYKHEQMEKMPWFYEELDPDLGKALHKLNMKSGTILDLCTGPGTQAIAMAKMGFSVTAVDISESAIEKAKIKSIEMNLHIDFVKDDMLNSKITEKFTIIFDRGCFHVIPPDKREDYVQSVYNLIESNGYLFIKCFSHLETRGEGPYRFAPAEIKNTFGSNFTILSIENTYYHGTLKPFPKALFCVMRKK